MIWIDNLHIYHKIACFLFLFILLLGWIFLCPFAVVRMYLLTQTGVIHIIREQPIFKNHFSFCFSNKVLVSGLDPLPTSIHKVLIHGPEIVTNQNILSKWGKWLKQDLLKI